MPASSNCAFVNAGSAAPSPSGVMISKRDKHRAAQAVDARAPAILSNAVAKDDIEHEERAVGKGKGESDWLAAKPDIGEQRAACQRQTQGEEVTPGANANSRQDNLAQEFDGAHGTQWQPRDGQIEAGVHEAQNDPQRNEQSALRPGTLAKQTPGTPPHREHNSRAGNAQPGHA